MPFIHPILLGALVTVGVPVLLHLLMRQKPKHQMFPAFRFLQQRAKTNQRKIRLRHLLLLLLRMLLLALIVLALARPRLFSDRLGIGFGSNQNVALVLVFDTSRSMEYMSGGKTRLDDAKQRALELLDEISEASRVAVVDTGDLNREWVSVTQARERIRNLNLNYGSQSVTNGIGTAYALFDDLSKEPATPETEGLPRILCVLSDRTVACWDPGRVPDVLGQRDRVQKDQPNINNYFIDVGVDKPIDIAIMSVEIKPQSIAATKDAEIILKVTVTATGQACDTELLCQVVGEKVAERKPVKLEAGQSETIEFKKTDLKPGFYQAEITLATTDALPGDNVRYVTWEVRDPRKILILTDDKAYANLLEVAFRSKRDFEPDVKLPAEMEPNDFAQYLAVCLLSVSAPHETQVGNRPLWDSLREYVKAGGHLCVFPGRDDLRKVDYKAALDLLPGEFVNPISAEDGKGVHWDMRRLQGKHALLAKFREWDKLDVAFIKRPPTALRFWSIKPQAKENVIVVYDDKDASPALLEKVSDKGAGKVLLFTTAFDDRSQQMDPPWNDYASSNDLFLLVIVNEAMNYLVGNLDELNFNYTSGQVVALPLPPSARFPEYTLDGQGLAGADTRLPREESATDLRLRNTNLAGNYSLAGGPAWKTRFSLNPASNEFQLDRVPVEEIEKLLGPDCVLPVEQNKKLTQVFEKKSRQPIELFPWLMLFFVLALSVESYLANRFYKPEPQSEPLAASP